MLYWGWDRIPPQALKKMKKLVMYSSSLGSCLLLCLLLESGSERTCLDDNVLRMKGGTKSRANTGLHPGSGPTKRSKTDAGSSPPQANVNAASQGPSAKLPTKEDLFQLSTQLFSPKASLRQRDYFKVSLMYLPARISRFLHTKTSFKRSLPADSFPPTCSWSSSV